MTTSIGLLGAVAAGIYGVSRVFGGMRRVYQGVKGAIDTRLDKPIYSRDGGMLSQRARERYGDTPDLTPRQLIAGQLHDPEGFRAGLEEEVARTDKLNKESRAAYDDIRHNYDDIKTHAKALVRQDYYEQYRGNILDTRVERDVLSETQRYEGELEDVSNRIHQEHEKIRMRSDTSSKEIKSLFKTLRDSEDAYGKTFQEEYNRRRGQRIQAALEPARQTLITRAIRTHEKQIKDSLKEAETKLADMSKESSQYGIQHKEVRRLRKLLQPDKPFTTDDMEFKKLRGEYLQELKERRVRESLHQQTRGGLGFLQPVKRAQPAAITDADLAALDQRVLRDLETRRSEAGETVDAHREMIHRQYADASEIKLDSDTLRGINDEVRSEVERGLESERQKLRQIQDNYYNALAKGDHEALAKYETQRRQLMDSFPDRIAEIERRSREAQAPLADEQARRSTVLGPDGLPIWKDAETESEVQKRERRAAIDAGPQQRRGARRDLKVSEGLLKRATANFKAINHLGFLTEIAYEGAIFGAIGLLGVGVVKLTTHFQQLYKQINYFKDFLDQALPSLVKWDKGFQEWRSAMFTVQHGFERLTPEMKKGIKAQIDFLAAQERGLGLADQDRERLNQLTREWESGKRALNQYSKAYFEFIQKSRGKELLDVRVGAEVSAEYGTQIKTIDDELKKVLSGKGLSFTRVAGAVFKDSLNPDQWKELTDAYTQMREAEGKHLKLQDGSVDFFGEAGFSLFRIREQNRMSAELRQQFGETLFGEDSKEARLLGERTPEAVKFGKTLEMILDLMAKRNFLAKEFTEFEKDRDRIAKQQQSAIEEAPRFEFDNVNMWSVSIGTARDELKRLKDMLLQVNPAMQDFYKGQIQHYKSIVSLEDSTKKSVESAYEKYREALDVQQLNEFLFENKDKYKDIVDKKAVDVIAGEVGDAPGIALLQDRARLLEIVGGQDFNKYIEKITDDSLHKNREAVKELAEQHQKTLSDFAEKMGEIRAKTLQDMQMDVQKTFREDLESGAAPFVRLQALEQYTERLRVMQGRESDIVRRHSYQTAIDDAVADIESIRNEIGRRTAQGIAIRDMLPQELTGGRAFSAGAIYDQRSILDRIIESEGGFDATDRRKNMLSYAGITQKSYYGYRKRMGDDSLPRSLKGIIGKDDIIANFYDDYFKRHDVDKVPRFMQYAYADFAVNSGKKAMKIIQGMLKVKETGDYDAATKAAFDTLMDSDGFSASDFIKQFTMRKMDFYRYLVKMDAAQYAKYLEGWTNRSDKVLEQSLGDLNRMFSGSNIFQDLAGIGGLPMALKDLFKPIDISTFAGIGALPLNIPTEEVAPVRSVVRPISGRTPEQDARDQQRLRDLGLQFSQDAVRNLDLWDRMSAIGNMVDPDKLNLSKNTLADIVEAMGRISQETQTWNATVGSVENKVLMLNTELVSARRAMRSVIQDEMNFWSGLDAPDRAGAMEKILKYREKATELQNVLDIRSQYESVDAMKETLALDKLQVASSPSIGDTPRAKKDIQEGIKELEKIIKLYDKSGKGLRELQRDADALRREMLEGWDTSGNRESLIKYLTGIRLQLNDMESGVPPADKIRVMTELLEGASGDSVESIKRRQGLEKEIQAEQDRLATYERLQIQFNTLIPLLHDEGEYLKYNRERWKEVTEEQKKAVANYEELIDAQRRSDIEQAVNRAYRSSARGADFPKAVEKIRGVGVGSGSDPLLSAQERVEKGIFFDSVGIHKIVTQEQIQQDLERDLNQLLRLQRKYTAQLSDRGKDDFRLRLEKEFAEQGRTVSEQEINVLMNYFEEERLSLLKELPKEIEAQSIYLNKRAEAQRAFYGVAETRKQLRDDIKAFAGRRIGEGVSGVWNALVINPMQARRDLADSRKALERQIADVRANEELSTRDKNERILEIEEDYAKRRMQLEEDMATERKRMWEDYALTVITDIGKIIEEQAKMRIGMKTSNFLLDMIPGLRGTTPPDEPAAVGAGSFYDGLSGWVTQAGLDFGLSLLADFIPGGSTIKSLLGSLFKPQTDIGSFGDIGGALSRQDTFLPSSDGPFLPMGGGFDNPIHDAKVWMSGYNQSLTYSKRSGSRSAEDVIRYFDAGFSDGMRKRSRGNTQETSGSSGSNLGKLLEDNLEAIGNLITAVETSEGKRPIIGDDELRRIHNRNKEMQRKRTIVP